MDPLFRFFVNTRCADNDNCNCTKVRAPPAPVISVSSRVIGARVPKFLRSFYKHALAPVLPVTTDAASGPRSRKRNRGGQIPIYFSTWKGQAAAKGYRKRGMCGA